MLEIKEKHDKIQNIKKACKNNEFEKQIDNLDVIKK